jgi:hypothetical protein
VEVGVLLGGAVGVLVGGAGVIVLVLDGVVVGLGGIAIWEGVIGGVLILVGSGAKVGSTGFPSPGVGSKPTFPVKNPVSVAEMMVFFLSFFLIAAAVSPKSIPLAPALSAINSKVYR